MAHYILLWHLLPHSREILNVLKKEFKTLDFKQEKIALYNGTGWQNETEYFPSVTCNK